MASNQPFYFVKLTEDDVPGAKLPYPMIENHSVPQLQRWLVCRGLKSSGNKAALIERVQKCIQSKQETEICISVDSGKWYQAKLVTLQKSPADQTASCRGVTSSSQPPLPPITGWRTFPSGDLPQHFNRGHIHHYIIESVQFIGDSSAADEDSDAEDEIDDLHTSKPLEKGQQFFESGHVKKMMDCKLNNHYFLKATVMSSFKVDVSYNVCLSLSFDSGYVADASCTCVASGMGRCNHVAATLFALLDYILKFGYEQESCTSAACGWNRGRKTKKDPRKIFDTQYVGKKTKKVDSLITFDPRPPSTRTNDTSEETLLSNIQWHQTSDSMWSTLLEYRYDDFILDREAQDVLKSQIAEMELGLRVPPGPYPHLLVTEQRTPEWHRQRAVRLTASECKAIYTAKSEVTIGNILRKHLWAKSDYKTMAMIYGIEHEDVAMGQYQEDKRESLPTLEVKTTGLWVNPGYPQLACSPDGLVMDATMGDAKFGLLEIKCPYVLKENDVADFDAQLTGQQKKSFCLEKDQDGNIRLKRHHNYYFQIQMQLGIMGLRWCDFYVWSKKGSVSERVSFDHNLWSSLKAKLVIFHKQWLCPEYFLMRLPRKLPPLKIQ